MTAKVPPLYVVQGSANDELPTVANAAEDPIIFDRQAVMDSFDDAVTRYGIALLKHQAVQQCEVTPYQPDKQEQSLQGVVKDPRYSRPVSVSMTAKVDKEEGDVTEIWVLLYSTCDCRHEDCSHPAALALHAIGTYPYTSPNRLQPVDAYQLLFTQSQQQAKTSQDTHNIIARWSRELNRYHTPLTTPQTAPDEGMVYLLDCAHTGAELKLTVEKAKRLKRGGYGKSKALLLQDAKTQSLMVDEDKAVFSQIYALQNSPTLSQSSFHFMLKACDALFHALLTSGKVYWRQTSRYPLKLGDRQSLTPGW